MTAQKNQIQALIAEIDGVLGKASPNLPWVMSRDAAAQRQLLGRIRGYLLTLQKAGLDQSAFQPNNSDRLVGYDIHSPANAYSTVGSPQQDAAQQILQAVVQEMGYLRANLTQPLQADIEALRQQREVLAQEVRQLEAQRQQYGLLQQQANQQQMLNEFLQVLMGRLQENLSQQIAQSLTALNVQALPYGASAGLDGAYSAALNSEYGASQPSLPGPPLLSPAQRLDHLQSLQTQSDHLLVSLDSSLSVVFETLQRNIQSYQDSLSQGIEKMHSLGYQGEVMFTALVNHLAQQLGREASSFLQSAAQPPTLGTPPTAPLPPITPTIDNLAEAAGTGSPSAGLSGPASSADRLTFKLPYPGSELPLPAPTFDVKQSPLGQGAESSSLRDLDLEDLDLSDLNLNEPDLTLLDGPNLDTLLDLELSSALPLTDAPTELQQESFIPESAPSARLELSGLPIVEEPTDLANLATRLQSDSTELEDAGPVDSEALEFLEQLSAALDESPGQPVPDVEASADVPALVADVEPSVVDDRIYEELDDFYATLFGDESTPTEGDVSPPPTVVEPVEAQSPDRAEMAMGEETKIEEAPSDFLGSMAAMAVEPTVLDDAEDVAPSLEEFFFGDEPSASVEPLPVPSAPDAPDVPSPVAEGFDELPLDLSSLFPEPDQPLVTPPTSLAAPELAAQRPVDVESPSSSDLEAAVPSLEELFFGDDPLASPVSAATSESPPVATRAASQPAQFDELPLDLSSLFGEPEPTPAALPEPSQADTLELLSSLLGEEPEMVPQAVAPQPVSPPPSLPTPVVNPPAETAEPSLSGFGEDSYIPAAPDEDLLVSDMNPDDGVDLSINASTLQQLSEDLSSLEGLDNLDFQELQTAFNPPVEPVILPQSQPSAAMESPELATWDSLTLSDFAETLPVTSDETALELDDEPSLPSVGVVAPTDAGTLTLEHIDDLFGDLPAVPAMSSGEYLGGAGKLESPSLSSSESPVTLNDVFADFFGSESETDQKKKAP